MKLNSTSRVLLSVLGAGALISPPAIASDNRTFSMAGAGVANGNYYQAASLNPALAARYEERDNFALILPSLRAEAADQDRVFDAIDAFQETYDRLESLLRQVEQGGFVSEAQLEQARSQLAQNFTAINGALVAGVGGQLALSIPNRFVSAQLFANADLQVFGAPRLDANDLDIFFNATNINELDNLASEGYVLGRLTTEFGAALARTMTFAGRELHLGMTPKIQEIESFTYFSALSDLDEDDFNAREYRRSNTQFNLDLGLSIPVNERLSAGLVLKNLFANEVTGQPIYSRQREDLVTLNYTIKPQLVAGVGYSTKLLSFSFDLDLTKQNYLGLDSQSQQLIFAQSRKTQFVRVGAELDLARWVQLRFGYRHDLEGSYDDAISAGLGLSPFGRVHFNLSAVYIDDRSFGAGAQLMFTF